MDLPVDEVADIRRADRGPASLDQGVGEDGETALGDLIAGDGPTVDDEVGPTMAATSSARRSRRCRTSSATCSRCASASIAQEPVALRETGRRLGLSSERVRQLEDRALRRLAEDDAVAALREAA